MYFPISDRDCSNVNAMTQYILSILDNPRGLFSGDTKLYLFPANNLVQC